MNLSEAMNMHISLENKCRFVKKFQEMLTFTYILIKYNLYHILIN